MLGLILFAITTPILGVILAHNQEIKKWLIPFGAGLLLATIFTHLLPELMQNTLAQSTGWGLVAGFGLYFILSSCLTMCPHDEHNCTNETHKGISKLLIVGFLVHALLDGIAIYSLSNSGVRDALIGLSVHRAIDGIALVALAATHKMPLRTVYEWFGLIIVTTLVGYGLGSTNMPIPSDLLTAFVCGTLIYMLASDMIPETHKSGRREVNIVAMLMGMAVAYTLANFTIHSH